MAISLGELKKICKERGDTFRAASIFGIGKNDSGKCDFFVTTEHAAYAVKVLTLGADALRVYFYRDRGYFTVKRASGEEDFMWVCPQFPQTEGGKPCVPVLLLDSAVPALELARGSVVTVTPGAMALSCRMHTPTSFEKLL